MSDAAVYGLLRLGGIDVALPLSALREVVPRPETLTGLPVVAPGLVGAMGLRSLVLPVLDLRPLLDRPDDTSPDQVVVVVAHEGRVVGLVADEVRGVTRVPDADLLPFTTAGARLLVSHAFRHEADATPVSVLDAEVLLSLPGVPTVAEARPTADVAAGPSDPAGAGAGARSVTLVRCGTQVLALEVGDIHTTIPLTEVTPSLLSGGDCLGVTVHAGREVAVVDPLTLLGLPPLPAADLGAGVVLDLGPGLVVLAVSELVELRDIGAGVLPVPAYAALRPDLLLGMVQLDGSAGLVLDGAAVRAEAHLLALAAVNTDVGGAAAVRSSDAPDPGEATAGPSYVTYTAGLALATPLAQVSEILPFPHELTPTAADRVLGLTVHRGRVVPVVCLSTLLGHPPESRPASSCLLLVEVDEEQVAFAVDALGSIEPLTWTDPAPTGVGPLVDLARAAHDSPLVQVAGTDGLIPDLDLRAVARAVRHTPGDEMSAPVPTDGAEPLNGPGPAPMIAA